MRITVGRLKQIIREASRFSGPHSPEFVKGDVVELGTRPMSGRSLQGLQSGERYEVVGSETDNTPFGGFVTYYVKPEGSPDAHALPIRNGHLILKRAD